MKIVQFQRADNILIFPIDICQFRCLDFTEFISHLKDHLQEGREISCHFMGCEKTYALNLHLRLIYPENTKTAQSNMHMETQTENVTENPGVSTENYFSEDLEAGGPLDSVDEALLFIYFLNVHCFI